MGKRKSSYQKLKEKNLELRQDIFALIKDSDKYRTTLIRAKYKFMADFENSVWNGKPVPIRTFTKIYQATISRE